jgi:hypothetical protein
VQNFIRIIVVIALAIGSIMTLPSVAVAADPGTISGYVYAENGSTSIGGALVEAYDYNVVDTNPSAVPAGFVYTAGSGAYTITNLPAGTYRVRAVAVGCFTEYYDNVSISSSADPVEVTAAVDPTGINFSLAPGGSISGLVFEEDGVTPINEAHVIAYDNSTGVMVKVDETWAPSSSNAYSLGTDLPAGNYLVKAQAVGYFSEYYDNVSDRTLATPVTATIGIDTPNIDFTLSPGGSISGSVYSSGGTPLYGAHIAAYDNSTGLMVDEIWTPGASPNYRMGTDLPAGSYLVKADFVGYYSEYYDNVTDPDLATLVVVTVPNDTPDINFTLTPQGFSISDVSASDLTENTATIVWTTTTGTTSQVAYGLDTDYGSSTTLDPNLWTSHSVGLTGLIRFTTYHYRVISKDVGNNEIVSGDYTFRTLDLTDPVISNVAATNVTATGATITWTTDEEASSYVRYGTSANYDQHTDQFDTNPRVTSHTVDLTGLASGTTYHYMVRSWDSSSNQADSGDYTFTTLDITAPVISAVSATSIAATSATIVWTTNEMADSQVEYGLTTSYGSTTTLDSNPVTSHSVNLTGLSSFKTYHYRVKSSDAAGNPASSADYTFTTADATAPTTPVVSDDGDSTTDLTQLHASWTSSDADSGIAEYQYAIGTTSGGTDVVNWTTVGTATSVTRTGLNLTGGTTYYFSVKAKNGQGLWSSVGTSNGIMAEEETTSGGGGGIPVWAWVLIGIGAVAVIGGLGYFAYTRLAQKQ